MNRLNYSTLEEVWGPNPVSTIPSHVLRDKENVVKEVELKPEEPIIKPIVKPIIEPMTEVVDSLKSCMLIEKHLNSCEICRNKFSNKDIENYDNYENFKETFENITPTQKNLLIIVIYGILIILISDLLIKDTDA